MSNATNTQIIIVGYNDLYKDAWKIREALREGEHVILIEYRGNAWCSQFEETRFIFELFDRAAEEFPIWHIMRMVEFPFTTAWAYCCEQWDRAKAAQMWAKLEQQ